MESVLDAAYTCFTRHGVRRTTMDDIARAADMSRPAVYQYVRNKEDVFRRLTGRLLEQTRASARAALTSPGDLTTRLTAALTVKLRLSLTVWRDSPAHAAELLDENSRLSSDLIETYHAQLRELLADTIAPAAPRAQAVEVAEILLAFTRGLEADLTDPDLPLRRLRQGVALLVAGLTHLRNPIHEETS